MPLSFYYNLETKFIKGNFVNCVQSTYNSSVDKLKTPSINNLIRLQFEIKIINIYITQLILKIIIT